MPTTEKLRQKLLNKLKELFQLNQPDLDFGFYRIMHVKADQVTKFIENDLIDIIRQSFAQFDKLKEQQLQADIDKAIQAAKEFGVAEPEETVKVKEARARYQQAIGSTGVEGEIYDHLYRFFERYYDDGDFISRRYYTRETPGKAAPYAIPYNGEEVKLHWANADQYYIKTAEHFTNFTFDLSLAVRETRSKESTVQTLVFDTEEIPENLKVHFKIVEAAEGEHNNVKESDKRFFIIHTEKPLEFNDSGELIIYFEYRNDPEKSKQDKTWRDFRNEEAVDTVLRNLQEKFPDKEDYYNLLSCPAPTESDKKRSLLAKYINKYTSRNTMDYFIHKNLRAFLKRELDFYIKNEIMRLDDIEYADAPTVESYLAKIKVLRKIAGKLIDFLAQLEDFQKKLWLKKKFITETNYCITIDRIPEELYPQITANRDQHQEWIKLFAIDEIEGDAFSPSYSDPLTVDFLKANDKLVLDTRFFDQSFKDRLIASIHNLDKQCDGLLIHSENFQALKLLQERYREGIKCIYIDPPYNTNASEIIYKNEYKHSSWLSLIENRVSASKPVLSHSGIFEIAIDNVEHNRLENLLVDIFSEANYITTVAIMNNPKGRDKEHIAESHDYTILFCKNDRHAHTHRLRLTSDKLKKKYNKSSDLGFSRELPLRRSGSGASRSDRPFMYFPFIYNTTTNILSVISLEEYKNIYNGKQFNDVYVEELRKKYEDDNFLFILPIREDGSLGRWRWGYETCNKGCLDGTLIVRLSRDRPTVYQIDNAIDTYLPKSLWYGERHDSSTKGTNILKELLGRTLFDYPKSIFTVMDFIEIGCTDNQIVCDYFAGSGTTGHAVINLYREDGGSRKYILVEMGDYFDTVLKPRISKVVYSTDWKEGKPKNRDTGISHCFKYIRLESYEDTLNNLRFIDDTARDKTLENNPSLKEDYMLHYLLDVETKGSSSLLNISSFVSPDRYKLKIKKPGSEEQIEQTVDLIETFNYLIGLRVEHITTPQLFEAKFKREPDPELPENQETKLVLDGDLKQAPTGKWKIRTVQGWVPKNRYNPNDGLHDKVLIVWRNLTGDREEDNLILDAWFQKNRISTRDWEFDTIYVNGSNNLPNLRKEDDKWKVILIEEEFHKRMWETEER